MSTISLKNENGIVIENNYGTIDISRDKHDGIWIYKPDASYGEERYIEFSLEDAKWIVENLQKVIEEFEKEPVEVPFEIGDVIGLMYKGENEGDETYHRVIKGKKEGEIQMSDFPSYTPASESLTPEDFMRKWNGLDVFVSHVLSHKNKA